ncbi:tRNA (adenosine(37)-N6)-dimethylallyltransferase MiaA [candidate division WOR-3 bacterium]|nr:tRNA (adenosine(37)-N6)-dimethylallyltransferase MiaA [candidate division WOR-3 bacterium]
MKKNFPVIVILGPTASGKTSMAVKCAEKFSGEIVSADSRQVYEGLDIGTGKDMDELKRVKFHLVDIVQPGEFFNLKIFQYLAYRAIEDITDRSKLPVICGGTALYLDCILNRYEIPSVKPDHGARKKLDGSRAGLIEAAKEAGIETPERIEKRKLLRKIEIFRSDGSPGDVPEISHPDARFLTIGLKLERSLQKSMITKRLEMRIEQGMIDEVYFLCEKGVSEDWLKSLGLEYRWCIGYLKGEYTFDFFFRGLRSDIVAFSKRQNSWYRRMEKKGLKIEWFSPDDQDAVFDKISDFV